MGVARAYKVGSPYNGVELDELDFEQTADTMFIAHIDHAPNKLVRTGHTAWTFNEITFGPSIAAPGSCNATATTPNTDSENSGASYFPQPASYVVTAVNDDTGEESRASNEDAATNDLTLKRNYNTITWASVTGATRYNIYKADNSQFFGYIGTTEDTTFRDDNIGPALDRAPPQAYNPFSGASDYPSTVTLFEQRSLWARTRNVPHGIWGSKTAQAENMDRSRPARADDSLALTIVAGRVNSVNQLVSTTSLLALTSDSVFNIDGDGSGGVLTADSPPAARRQIGRGSSRLGPLVIDNVVFYAPSVGTSVRTIGYDFAIDGLKSNDVTIFSPHFFDGHSIVSWCWAQEPRSLIWAARDDGKLVCFTWEQEQQVWGWTLCETDGLVKSVCCISESGEDRVYLLVDRDVNGVTKRFVERMASHAWDDIADTCFMDCAVTGEFETAKREFTGLWHLEGRSDVVGMIDGMVVTGLTVTDGTLTLPDIYPAASKATFGIPYQVDIETLPVRMNTQSFGSNIGRRQQVGEIALMLTDTRTIEAGIDADHLFPVKQRTSEAYGDPTALMDGEYEIAADNKAGENTSVYIRQTVPDPLTVLGIALDPIVNG
jgi:hypothetical protein